MTQQRIVYNITLFIETYQYIQRTTKTICRRLYGCTNKFSSFGCFIYLISNAFQFYGFRSFGRIIVKSRNYDSNGITQSLGISLCNGFLCQLIHITQQCSGYHGYACQHDNHVFQR